VLRKTLGVMDDSLVFVGVGAGKGMVLVILLGKDPLDMSLLRLI